VNGPSGPRRPGGPRPGGHPPADRHRRAAGRTGARAGRPAAGQYPRQQRPVAGGTGWSRRPFVRTSQVRRLNLTLLAIGLALSLIVGRLIQLQGIDAPRFRAVSQHQQLRILPIPAVRGEITSSDGTVLAMTVQTDQVYADPPLIAESTPLAVAAAKLAGPLRMTQPAVLALLRHPTSPDYVLLKKQVGVSAAGQIDKLGLPGVGLKPSYSRQYPDGNLAAGLLGFTDLRGSAANPVLAGVAGVEYAYDRLLAGRPGREAVEEGPSGLPIPGTQAVIKPAVPAGGLRLTIQADIQWAAEQACARQVKLTRSKNCSVIVMQPGTGKILAMAQYPTFDPARPASLAATTNIAIGNVFAPGSTAKVITAAAAFQHGQTPLTSYRVPDQFWYHGFPFHDAEYHPTLRYTIAGIIAHSLNDGMVQVASGITQDEQYAELRAFGLGSPSGLHLPGEAAGILAAPRDWWGNERYLLSFGQGIDVTAVQMASVYATIANGGVRVTPSVVAGTTTGAGRYVPAPRPSHRRVLPRSVAAELMSVLEQVPVVYAQGGEPWGLIPGYTVAAKTGTAQEQGHTYGSSFIGIAPATHPKLVVAVNLQDPRGKSYFGIDVAGPVFNQVMKFALLTLKIPPDGGHVPSVPLTVP
jgi:cell division protein FtsI (penicillin-binding protein 3)